jgi:hypothetical protein
MSVKCVPAQITAYLKSFFALSLLPQVGIVSLLSVSTASITVTEHPLASLGTELVLTRQSFTLQIQHQDQQSDCCNMVPLATLREASPRPEDEALLQQIH